MTYNFTTDFNDAAKQAQGELIPAGTIAKACFSIKPGGQGANQWYTETSAGAIYLNGDFTILEGPYAKRKVFTMIGLKSPKATPLEDKWAEMGKATIRAMLESARNIHPKDESPAAQQGRRIRSIEDLLSLECVIKIGIEHDKTGMRGDRNKVVAIITPEHKAYCENMKNNPLVGNLTNAASNVPKPPYAPAMPAWANR